MKGMGYLGVFLLAIALSCGRGLGSEGGGWPSGIDVSLALASRADARLQLAGEGYGPVGRDLTLRVGGWIATGSDGTRGVLNNAYVGMDRPRFYAAAGQKFVVFGPGGLLVSPGARGGEAVVKGRPISLQLLGGRTQFTPPAGAAGRFTPNSDPLFGEERRREEFFAARTEYDLERGGKHTYFGLNALWTTSRSGVSFDVETPLSEDRAFYAEVSSFDGTGAQLGGIRFKRFGKYLHTSRDTALDIFWRNVPEDYIPAQVGATQYYPDQGGPAAVLYHRVSGLSALGIYGDSQGVTVNFFRQFFLEE